MYKINYTWTNKVNKFIILLTSYKIIFIFQSLFIVLYLVTVSLLIFKYIKVYLILLNLNTIFFNIVIKRVQDLIFLFTLYLYCINIWLIFLIESM